MLTRAQAITWAGSGEWERRVDAAAALAPYADGVAERWLERLLDDEDTAVIEAAVEALLRQQDSRAAALFLAAYSTSEDHVGDHMNDVVRELEISGVPVRDLCHAVLRDGDGSAKAGGAALLRWLGVNAR